MKGSTRFALLSALVLLAASQVAQACWHGHGRVVYSQAYYPRPAYYMPYCPPSSSTYAASTYAARQAAEVGAYDGEGFKPKSITVSPGTTVRWVNHGKERHTVTSRDGLFDSGELAPGATYSVKFNRPGTYHYFCRPHEKMGMVGTVVVGYDGAAQPSGGYGGSRYSGY